MEIRGKVGLLLLLASLGRATGSWLELWGADLPKIEVPANYGIGVILLICRGPN
jgi:hypothetical protein